MGIRKIEKILDCPPWVGCLILLWVMRGKSLLGSVDLMVVLLVLLVQEVHKGQDNQNNVFSTQ